MIKKRFFSLILAVCLLAVLIVPATADKPNVFKAYWPPTPYLVTDCSEFGYDFKVYDSWDQDVIYFTFYDRNGDTRQERYHADIVQLYITDPDTGKTLSSTSQDTLFTRDAENSIFELRGAFQRIIIPGEGPIFMDIGRKLFYGRWMPDGSLVFELIENAGPTSYTSMNFKALCDYLAP